jgi:putative transposase
VIINGEMQLNAAGKMIYDWWYQIPHQYKFIELDEFIVIPNHVHGIILIHDHNHSTADIVGVSHLAPTFFND